jgi:ABC-type transport system substrate-binding protein
VGRREFLQAAGLLGANAAIPLRAAEQSSLKTFRWAFVAAETGFDPAQISDLYSNYVVANVFESPLQYDFLARPALLRPRTAVGMPEISADFRTFTVRIRPGILFQDDPAFKGKPRELTAHDYVYSTKRVFDPRWKSPLYTSLNTSRLLGLDDLRKQAIATGKFDYDREVEGLRALDRYTFQVRLAEPEPRFILNMTDARPFGAVAREVVEAYADDMMAHPVGTGPFRLAQWKRSSFIVLERNPTFRDEFYDAQPPADDVRGQQIAARLKGRKLPMVDRVELSVIEESQPRWLSFLNGEQDVVNVPLEFINQAVPYGKVSPALVRKGINLDRIINPDIVVTLFNMDDPVVGGYSPEKVALRRAINLGYDTEEEIRLIRNGSMMPAQSPVPPPVPGFDPAFVSEMNRFDRAAAQALLETYGYLDRDGDGWREHPDGSPLLLEMACESSQLDRKFNELWQRHLNAIGLKVRFKVNQWPENAKNARAGKLMMWQLGWSATEPDADTFYSIAYGPNKGAPNYARFVNSKYDKLYEIQRTAPDGPERDAAMRELNRLFVVYLPYKVHGHRFVNDVMHPWLVGYRRHPYGRDFFKHIDIDPVKLVQRST